MADPWSRKDKAIGHTFGGQFSWDGLIDAAADVYNGVSGPTKLSALLR